MKNTQNKTSGRKRLHRKRRRRKLLRLFLIFILVFLIATSIILGLFVAGHIYRTYFNKADIVLDAGHGGKDPGANAEDAFEKDITLKITQMTRKILEDAGYKVSMTRTEDTFIELPERSSYANRKRADIFVSIHCNSSEDGLGKGIETYYTEQKGKSSENLANEIQDALVENTNAENREVRTADYTVIVETNMPSALVEVGFLTDSEERRLLQQEKYQKKLAEGIAEGIINYYSLEK